MKAGRKPAKAAEIIDVPVNEALLKQDKAAQNTLAVIELSKQDYTEQRDLANQMLGQIQMSRAISKFTDVVGLSKLKYIKENKIYRAVAGQKALDANGNEITDVGTWEGFCRALGTSQQKVDEDLLNLKVFGEEALQQMQSTGIGYRDLRQFRRLPADQKSELIEAAKAGDTATLLELAEDLIVKHAKEKDVLAKDQRIETYSKRIDTLQDAADAAAEQESTLGGALEKVTACAHETLGYVRGDLRKSFASLAALEDGGNTSHRGVMAGFVADLRLQLDILEGDFFLGKVQS
jgi:hypothetical protein